MKRPDYIMIAKNVSDEWEGRNRGPKTYTMIKEMECEIFRGCVAAADVYIDYLEEKLDKVKTLHCRLAEEDGGRR